MEREYEYHEDLDILYVFNNPNNEVPKYNLVKGNIVIDFGENGGVLGVEIDCPSKFFNLSGEQLLDLKGAKVEVMKSGEMLSVGVFLFSESKEHRFQFEMPSEDSTQRIVVGN
ncbi:hypothetical protein CMI38_05750 [Candidatus Pacearchaeota archaeon]|jgi:uncharacterized protein YuzE|nr:hypothetical protein [Candidatus Pacearchaeota archaeon]|tara:strand:+ start:328 stop:666 length:339 start_codon:yes stop_codon:yes gene_type:complete